MIFKVNEYDQFSANDAHTPFKGDPSDIFYRLSDDPWFDRLADYPCFCKTNPDYLFERN